MGFESKYGDGIQCGLAHFGEFFLNFCLRYCCLSRMKDIDDHLFPQKQLVGHELLGGIVTTSFMMVVDPWQPQRTDVFLWRHYSAVCKQKHRIMMENPGLCRLFP